MKNSFNEVNEMNRDSLVSNTKHDYIEDSAFESNYESFLDNLDNINQELSNDNSKNIIKDSGITKIAFCDRCQGLFFINLHTGERINARCKAYKCEYCGPRKAYRLQCALIEYFSQFKHLRMFTFTYRTTIFKSVPHAIAVTSEVWRRFINNIRRSTSLSDYQRNVSYVKVIEYTKRGYPHYHVIFSEFLPIQVVSGSWNRAINTVLQHECEKSTVNISYSGPNASTSDRRGMSPELAAKYIAKYTLKAAANDTNTLRKWSKSEKVKLFPDKPFSCGWVYVNVRHSLLNLETLCVSSQTSLKNQQKHISFYEIAKKHFPEASSEEIINRAHEMKTIVEQII